ncbi:hypothetical protein ACLKA6_000615 [Drosophila palustris]
MYQQEEGRFYKQPWSGRGRGRRHGRGFGGWRQYGPPLPFTGSASRCHRVCGKCCVGWEAAPPSANIASAAAPQAAAPQAAAPPGWVRIEDLRPAQAAGRRWQCATGTTTSGCPTGGPMGAIGRRWQCATGTTTSSCPTGGPMGAIKRRWQCATGTTPE